MQDTNSRVAKKDIQNIKIISLLSILLGVFVLSLNLIQIPQDIASAQSNPNNPGGGGVLVPTASSSSSISSSFASSVAISSQRSSTISSSSAISQNTGGLGPNTPVTPSTPTPQGEEIPVTTPISSSAKSTTINPQGVKFDNTVRSGGAEITVTIALITSVLGAGYYFYQTQSKRNLKTHEHKIHHKKK